jgi:putative membrane protein
MRGHGFINGYGPGFGPEAGMMHSCMGGGAIFAGIIFLVVVGLAVFAILKFSKRGKIEDSSIDILNERFAKGEIDIEEFKERKALLKK